MSVFGPPLEAQRHGAAVFHVDIFKKTDATNACMGEHSTISMEMLDESNLPHVSVIATDGAPRQCYDAASLVKHLQSVNQDGREWGKLVNRDPNTNMGFTASQRADIFASTTEVDDQTGERVVPDSWVEDDDAIRQASALFNFSTANFSDGGDNDWMEHPLPPALFPWARKSTWGGMNLGQATPLAAALIHEFDECARWLLEHGADARRSEVMPSSKCADPVDGDSCAIMTMLDFVLQEGHGRRLVIASALIAHGADVNEKGLFAKYITGAGYGAEFRFLIEHGTAIDALVDRPPDHPATPIYILVELVYNKVCAEFMETNRSRAFEWKAECVYIMRAKALVEARADCWYTPRLSRDQLAERYLTHLGKLKSQDAFSVTQMLVECMNMLSESHQLYALIANLLLKVLLLKDGLVIKSAGKSAIQNDIA